MLADARFLFLICQVGAEAALKDEMSRLWPAYRLAFSRPGFVTFKLPDNVRLAADFDPGCTLARTSGFSLGKIKADKAETAAVEVWRLARGLDVEHLHVWQRDAALPGMRNFEPGITPLATEVAGIVLNTGLETKALSRSIPINQHAQPDQRILDCVLVEPNEWWVGWHVASTTYRQWPGGVPIISSPSDLISRAYFKMQEAIEWSRVPIKARDRCAEIGSAPGGAVQALLERKLVVLGIDPAEMDESVRDHPNFTHIRKRAADLKRREFRDVKWLFADSNISPHQTLDDIEDIVTHREVHIRGLLLTLKLTNWKLMERVPEWRERVASWGYSQVATRQLAFNRREICLAARK